MRTRFGNGLVIDPATGWVIDAGAFRYDEGQSLTVSHVGNGAVAVYSQGPIAVLTIPLIAAN